MKKFKQYFRKRTKEEEDAAIKNGDKTGGYKFLPWIVWKRPFYILYFSVAIFIVTRTLPDIGERSTQIFLIGFGVVIILVVLLLIRSYFKDGGGRK